MAIPSRCVHVLAFLTWTVGGLDQSGKQRDASKRLLEAHDRTVVRPPEDIKTVSHSKKAGGGYLSGSPLYKEQSDDKVEKSERLPAATPGMRSDRPPPSGFLLPLLSILCGLLCVGGVWYWNHKTMTALSKKEPPSMGAYDPLRSDTGYRSGRV
eukprot:CAMPEP_0169065804 /NCGR_PEP_ID=MMETSP1015-20121227/2600_1 /TAXON_ID=342587 /ORGANISM="Karlodinium micrum, Strain CCMP2283" /LENGTH=153 /DNA_ID=CAMNT_0009124405 /DNA_START=45 /DNA_END=506 /DNA_ORIENTATION=-